jgi:hypothetical protein
MPHLIANIVKLIVLLYSFIKKNLYILQCRDNCVKPLLLPVFTQA